MVMVPRIPPSCPNGFNERYVVKTGDAMYKIARSYGIGLNILVNANPHIPHPSLIVPGDVLCVPKRKFSSFCTVLEPRFHDLPFAIGSALVSNSPKFDKAVSMIAILPSFQDLGKNYKAYQAYLIYATKEDSRAISKLLYPVRDNPYTWATTIDLTTDDTAEMTADVKIIISATLSDAPSPPPGNLVILEGMLEKIK
ncbi:LysM peptidoglycan-binding domain-containing protein [Thermotalea metallivorans]|uniref:LysM domain-containing protein n=1 Tax=Thermotalea metallivorans TaxID=520762 RepID=A0A140L7Z0_9FIRM|nr:LysM peptidoglycan-binding domain-containing protein [Thermotalea metallivorans]KXG76665.1 hypothetical protein AN619_08840 [Thermotalea metallivorans]